MMDTKSINVDVTEGGDGNPDAELSLGFVASNIGRRAMFQSMEESEYDRGAGLVLDTSAARPEEEDAEERRARERELHSQLDKGLENYFTDEEDSNMDETEDEENMLRGSQEENLKLLCEVRLRELQRMGEKLEACQREAAENHDKLYARLAIANAEKERAHVSLQQSQELVVSSRHRIVELEHEVSSLKVKMELLQTKNEELVSEVTATNAGLIDAQNRLQTMKMNNGNNQNLDVMFKAQQERYKEDTDRLERDLSRTRNKLTEKENELLSFEKRYIEMERMKEDLLVEKGATINKLALELEEAQNRLTKNDTMKLNDKIMQLTSERNSYKHQVKELASKLEITAKELVDTRNNFAKLQNEIHELESTLEQVIENRDSDSFSQLKGPSPGYNISPNIDKMTLLKHELTKSIKAQKLKRDQINKLNIAVEKKDEIIMAFKKNEDKLKREIKELQEVESQISSELKLLKSQLNNNDNKIEKHDQYTKLEKELKIANDELREVKNRYRELHRSKNEENSELMNGSNPDVQKEHNKILYQLKDANKQIDELKDMYIEVCVVKEKLSREVDELKSSNIYKTLEEERSNVEELLHQLKLEKIKVDELGNKLLNQQLGDFQKQLNNLKKDDSKLHNNVIEEYKINIDMLNMENKKLKQLCQDQSNNLSSMSGELEESKKLINELNAEIELQRKREEIVETLKDRAKQFEDFIMDQKNKVENRKNASTLTDSVEDLKKNEDDEINIQQLSAIEDKIRKDMGYHFASEMKSMELQYNKKISFIKHELEMHIEQLGQLLQTKTREVETLQGVIMLERQKVNELSRSQSPIDKSQLHEKCKKQLQTYSEHVESLKDEIMKSNEIKKQLDDCLKESENMKEKYRRIKKTAIRYKEYIEEKDKHINGEMERIKDNYKESLKKMQDKLDSYIRETDKLITKKAALKP